MMPGISKSYRILSKKRLATILIFVSLVLCCAATIVAECERFWWSAYLVAQFRVEFLSASILLFAILLFKQSSRMAIASAFICCVLNGYHLVPFYFGNSAMPLTTGKTLRLLQLNLNWKNREFRKVAAFIHSVNADAVLIEELTPEWQQYLSAHLADYHHSVLVPRNDTYGIGIYSKKELKNRKIEFFGSSGHPSIAGCLQGLREPVWLVHTHVQGPVMQQFFAWHREHFEQMLPRVQEISKPKIVAGDMNSNSWTYFLSDFLKDSNMIDTQKGRGIHLSWPVPFYWRHWPTPLLSIDHYFVSDDIIVYQRKICESISSDHLPVLLEFGLR